MTKENKIESMDKLSASLENYLETIALLIQEKKHARVGDIAKALGVKSSSVNVAVNFLSENGLVIHEKYGYVDLTKEGKKVAAEVQKKHDILYRFFNELLFVDSKTALKEACETEHCVSIDTIHKLERLYFFLKDEILNTPKDMLKFQKFLEEDKKQSK